jgi:hypothetical protein
MTILGLMAHMMDGRWFNSKKNRGLRIPADARLVDGESKDGKVVFEIAAAEGGGSFDYILR